MSQSSNKSFGILFSLVFLTIGVWPVTKNNEPVISLIILSIIFLILGLFNSKLLTPLNFVWVQFGEILGKIIAPIVMLIIYFVILTPLGIIIRLFGKDLLNINSREKNSYWIKRNKDLGSMKKQF